MCRGAWARTESHGCTNCSCLDSHLMPRATEALTCVKPDISSLPNFLKAIFLSRRAHGGSTSSSCSAVASVSAVEGAVQLYVCVGLVGV